MTDDTFDSTIVAIATAIVPQQGSVGIVRLSGSRAEAIARRMFSAPGKQVWESHRILYGYIKHPTTGVVIDESLLLVMKAPRSYTREDVVEFHCHGGAIAVQQTLNLCLEQGARLAQPGEFTLRAFLHGRIDLTQAESINDLVGARSPQAAEMAIAGLQGKLAQPLRQLRQKCVDILAEIEARIDFEDDLPPLDTNWVKIEIDRIATDAQHILDTADRGELLRAGLKVAIVGRPNVGKSSLLNAWSRSDRAIVTDLPGTTRDVVDSQLVVGGIPIQVLDTAGIRETEDKVEKIGVERSRRAAQAADIVLLVIDAQAGWLPEDRAIFDLICDRPTILVINKVDLVDGIDLSDRISIPVPFSQIVHAAVALDRGIDLLESAILTCARSSNLTASNLDIAINQRQKACLLKAVQSLHKVMEAVADRLPLDFWTIDLRAAIAAIGEITGEEVTESVLDRIFSRFCIGK
ncbi:tRNA uridine-5-carboxymethylaminomethyl(34) synthesis GTPase MnmE [Pseudanabaena sp. PCC 6802]|uniref:tRNA uridine-5-carboxymethylaminomethyl(34) synthesis GTPase MnmE n=1 Tax=Pseudanabaena sp. PCC 6802 TaxID=118173 RepID=UPI000344DA7E|nr:tRNA uridine-5-carboxymethylaminomethyl(34) synthesis GTPase MnmE [Pseudanabaena sp. PCC 6802]